MEHESLTLHQRAGELVWVDLSDSPRPQPWWTATHIAHLPPGVTLADLWDREEVDLGLCEEVPSLSSGLNDPQMLPHDQETRAPSESRTVAVGRVLGLVPAFVSDEVEEGRFFVLRDAYRVEHDLPRAVVRSDHYNTRETYFLAHPWPAGTFAQGGTMHTRVPATAEQEAEPDVYTRDGHTLVEAAVFIEVVPPSPSTLLRGEATTYAEAEAQVWAKWSRIVGCPSPTGGHEFEARGYRNGVGTCAHCGLRASGVIDLASVGSLCVVCGTPSYWCLIPRLGPDGTLDRRGEQDIVCPDHAPGMDAMYVEDALEEHARGRGPVLDYTWFADYLPAGVPLTQVNPSQLREAVDRGRRDLLDAAIAAHAAAERTGAESGSSN